MSRGPLLPRSPPLAALLPPFTVLVPAGALFREPPARPAPPD
ncbi:hypothetical protein [Micromonospora echinospora]